MREKKKLSKAVRKLMAELVVTPLYVMKYQTWNSTTGVFSAAMDICTDGISVFEEQKIVPFALTKNPLRSNAFISALQKYVEKKFNPTYNPYDLYGNPPQIQIYDHFAHEKYKPTLNRNHPWVKR